LTQLRHGRSCCLLAAALKLATIDEGNAMLL
jgi:hypothetical protein